MSRKEIMIQLGIVSLIFLIGFLMRIETVNPNSPNDLFFQDQNGLPYMYEMDSYYNYRLTQNYLEHGYLGDVKIEGIEWDMHSYYPPGVPLDYPPMIVYLTGLVFYLVNLISEIPLLVVSFWLPAFIAPLAGVIVYLMLRRYINDYGAIVGGFLMVLVPYYFLRTVPGWYDTDMFTILLPLIVVWLFMESINSETSRKAYLLVLLSSCFMFLFSIAWNGWQLYFYLIAIFSIFYILWLRLKNRSVKEYLYIFITFSAASILLITIFSGYLNIIKLIYGPVDLLKIFGAQGTWSPWPDSYIAVSEMERPSLEKIASGLGLSLIAGIVGLIVMGLLLIKKSFNHLLPKRIDMKFYLFILIWILIGFLALLKGSRFMLLVIPPLVICSGILIGLMIESLDLIKNKFSKQVSYNNVFAIVILGLVLFLSVFNIWYGVALMSDVNDDLWNASLWIDENTPNNTVVISGWSYGHIITAIADRPVIFDGRLGYIETLSVRNFEGVYPYGTKSPAVYKDYWISKAFITDNETLSSGIFSMLATSGDSSTIILDGYTKNTTKTVEILNNILGVDRENARSILLNRYQFDINQTDNILKYSHPIEKTPYVLFTPVDMIKNAYWLFYFGSWDFNQVNSTDFVYSYGDIEENDGLIKTTNGVYVDLISGNTTYNSEKPYAVVLIQNGSIEKRLLNQSSVMLVVLMMDSGQVVVIDKRFENSVFFKLLLARENTTEFRKTYQNKNTDVWMANQDN